MRLFDVLLGRSRPVQPNLDVLFAVPAAADTLRATLDLRPTGAGTVCFKHPEGAAASTAQSDITALLSLSRSTTVEVTRDGFGYTWVTCTQPEPDLPGLVTDLHAVNTTLADAGFGPTLLCTVIGFAGRAHRLGLVYLFKRGTLYPFAPTGPQSRDNAFELEVRAHLSGDVPVEADLSRWFPVWDAPVP
jgi:hypothetical protein